MYNCNEVCSCFYTADYAFLKSIEEYIYDELKDSKYYAILSKKAPTRRAKDLLMEFSKDELTHAENFMKVYSMLTGNAYQPTEIEQPVVPAYMEALKVRIIAETGDYKKYGEQYLKAVNPYIKDLFYMTRTEEAQHAMRMPILMTER